MSGQRGVDRQDDGPLFRREGGEGGGSRILRALGASIPLFRAGGIRFRLHWTFPLVALGFASWTASSGHGAVGTTALSARPGAEYHVLFAWGLVQAAMLYALVVLHELGHATAGRLRGRPAGEIILTPLGGQAVIDRAMAGPGMEAEVSIAGPGVNLVLLAISMAPVAFAGWGMPAAGGAPFTLAAAIGFAFWANTILAVFNLAPAFPMDGGRILRAFLAWRRGAGPGTVIAARVGEVMGAVFVALGIWRGGPGGWVLGCIGVLNFIACEQTVRAVARGYGVYEEYVDMSGSAIRPAPPTSADLSESAWRGAAKPGRSQHGGVGSRRETREERAAREREEVERRVDELLAKVSRDGMASLTSRERRFLKKASRKYRDAGS